MSAQLIGSVSEAKFKAKIEASRPTIALGATPVVPVVCDTLQAERVRSAIRDSEASPQAHSSHECEKSDFFVPFHNDIAHHLRAHGQLVGHACTENTGVRTGAPRTLEYSRQRSEEGRAASIICESSGQEQEA